MRGQRKDVGVKEEKKKEKKRVGVIICKSNEGKQHHSTIHNHVTPIEFA